MNASDLRAGQLDAAIRRQILEIAREHDQKLKSVEQDLFRAETKLRVERRWQWLDRGLFFIIGVAVMTAAAQAGVMAAAGALGQKGLAKLAIYLTSTVDIVGVPVPLNALLFILIALTMTLILVTVASLRPSPQRAARKLMKKFDKDPAVQGFMFRDGVFPKSSYDSMREQDDRTSELDFAPPTLELVMYNLLNPSREQPPRTRH
jgi:hypothetical protein